MWEEYGIKNDILQMAKEVEKECQDKIGRAHV